MSRFYQRDKNHKDICADLEKRGVCVVDLAASGGGVADIVTHKTETVFIEIKFGKKAEVKKTQLKFLGNWKGYCGFAETIDEAYRLAVEPEKYALTYAQKQKLLGVWAMMKTDKIHYETLKKEL